MKLGKQEAAPRSTDFLWRKLSAAVVLPTLPSRFGHAWLFKNDWEMLGNDQYGDCVWAGAAHEHRMFGKVVHGVDTDYSDENVLADYSAVTGFDASDPSTDQGTYVHDALSYRRKTGILDAAGKRHKIGAYVSLDPKNWDHLVQAVYIFGAVGIGFNFPASAFAQFDAGQSWSVVSNDGGIEGGHYVPVLGMPNANTVATITWGKRQVLTRGFYEKYNDESWAIINQDSLHADGTGLHHFSIDQLNAYLAALD